MHYNDALHVGQTKTPAGTEVTARWSCRVYVGEGVAASCRKCVSGFVHYLTVGFGQHFKTSKWPQCAVSSASKWSTVFTC